LRIKVVFGTDVALQHVINC